MNLKEWAASQGVSYATARRWYEAGTLPVPTYRAGRLIVVGEPLAAPQAGQTVAYCRVSSHDQEADLERQAGRVLTGASGRGIRIDRTVTEIGSGRNGRGTKLGKLLTDPKVSVIVVERRDRLAWFGVEYLEAALAAHGRSVVVLDETDLAGELARDLTEVLTVVCARLYGRRSAARRAAAAVAAIEAEPDEAPGDPS